MVADLSLAIQLQDFDSRIAQLQHEIAALPKHIASIERTLESHNKKLEADRAALSANQRERKQLELDVQAQEQRVSKLRDQMLQAKTNEQYTAFRHEIEFCEKEIRKFEDRILDRMGEAETLDRNVKAAETALAKEKLQVEAEKKAARERTDADKAELEKLLKRRAEVVAQMSKPVHAAYERIRKRARNVAVAEAVEGRCAACNMTVRLQFLQELRRNDKVMFCESCGRILYCNPPVEFDESGPGTAVPDTGQPVSTPDAP